MRVSSIRWGVIWVGVGFLFLAINFEVMDSLVFPRLFTLWPVLLIAVGVELIFRKTRLYFLALLSPLMIAAAFIAAASYQTDWGWDFDKFFSGWSWNYKGESLGEMEIPEQPGIDTLKIRIDCGDVGFDIQSVSGIEFSARSVYRGRSPIISDSSMGNVEWIDYEYRDRAGFGILDLWKDPSFVDFEISDMLPVSLRIVTGGKKPAIDLSEIKLVSLDLSLRSKETKLRVGDLQDSVEIRIEGRTRSLDIAAPEQMGFALVGDPGQLDKALVNDDFTDSSVGFRSIDFEESPSKAYVFINARVEIIRIDRD